LARVGHRPEDIIAGCHVGGYSCLPRSNEGTSLCQTYSTIFFKICNLRASSLRIPKAEHYQ
jgi:hypothetical protein